MKPIKVEVCVESLASAKIAAEAGAHRIELNTAIGLGGLTPSINLLQQIKSQIDLKVICMVRPRPGDFFYNEYELDLMIRDALSLIHSEADGLAIGCLDAQQKINKELISKFRKICGEKELVFHRAFDCVSDPIQAANELIELGVDRVLTSGGETTAMAGQSQIADLIFRFGEQIEWLPGSGVNHSNVRKLVDTTGCDQVHGTFARVKETGATVAPLNFNDVLGLASNQKKETDFAELRAVVAAVSGQE